MRPLRLLGITLLAFVCAAPAPATAADRTISDTITIGDSVMLGAKWALLKRGVEVVDAEQSRQADMGASLIRERGRSLPGNVVVHLGTNGSFPSSTCREIVSAAGPGRRVFLLTISVPRRWEAANNARIRRCADLYPDRVTLVDWQEAAEAHPGWLYADHIHLRPEGARGYARLIAAAVGG